MWKHPARRGKPTVLIRRLAGHRLGLRLPRRTIRVRLAVLFFAVFLASGAALLAVTVVVWLGRTGGASHVTRAPAGSLANPAIGIGQHSSDSHQLLIASGIALAIMGGLSLALGWLVAGRFLAPLRTITTTTRRISATNLDERLNLAGPDDELKELGDTFDELLARLESSFASERQFVANASHELRTPLATMRASLDVAMAKPGPVPAHIQTLAERLRHELDQVDRLLESFLTLARTQQRSLADQSTLSLDEITAAALERHAHAISALELTVDREGRGAWVTGSEMLLSRMVENVIDNAVKHNQPGGWIRVTTAIDGPLGRLVVENGGPVLAPDDVSELARPFQRIGAERTGSDNGTGLGLAIVASIAQAHGGTLELHARPAGGLRVAIALPLADGTAGGARA